MGGVRVGSVVIDCNDFDRMFAFWAAALGYLPRDEPEDDWVVLRLVTLERERLAAGRSGAKGREESAPSRSVREGPGRRDRADRGARCDDPPQDPEPDEDFIVLADPEGNLFCVIQKDG